MKRIHFTMGGVLLIALVGCGSQGPEEVGKSRSALLGGTVTDARPEIGWVRPPGGGGCTATLVSRRWVLTAAHCVNFMSAAPLGAPDSNGIDPSQYVFIPGDGTGLSQTMSFPAASIVNLGPLGPAPSDPFAETNWLEANQTLAGDNSGNNDIALLLLATDVPPWVVPTPASLASSPPALGDMATQFGYGCTETVSETEDWLKRFASWPMPTPYNTGGIQNGGHICSGDSGGPVVVGALGDNGSIWGVNSSGTGTIIGIDTFGSVSWYHSTICQTMHWGLPWWEAWGVAGIDTARGCDEAGPGNADDVVRFVCDNMPACCSTQWTPDCVALGMTVANPPPPPVVESRSGRGHF